MDNMNMRRFAGIWYVDQAINNFIAEMKKDFSNSLFVVTGYYVVALVFFNYGFVNYGEQSIRET